MVVPSRRLSWSLAAATCRSLWVSTPTVTRGGWGCAMVSRIAEVPRSLTLAPLAVDQFLPGDRAGIPLHGVTTPAKVPSDGAQTMPLGEQAVHQRMVASGALGEPPHRRCLLSGRRRSRLLGLLGCGRAQAVAVAGNAALGRLGQVLPQVEPVGDLPGVGGAQAGAFGVGSRAVSADDLHAGVAGQPLGQRRGLAAGEQFDRCAGLAVG